MKLTKVITIILCLAAIAWSLDAPAPLYDMNGQLRKLGLITTVQDIYVRLGNTIDNFSSQTIGGNKTFTGTTTFSSSTKYSDGTEQTTAYKVMASTYTNPATGAITATSYTTIIGSTVTIVTSGGTRVRWDVIFNASVGVGAFNMTTYFNGNDQGGSGGMLFAEPVGGAYQNYHITGISGVLSAGTHTLFLRAKVASGTTTIYANVPFTFLAQEFK